MTPPGRRLRNDFARLTTPLMGDCDVRNVAVSRRHAALHQSSREPPMQATDPRRPVLGNQENEGRFPLRLANDDGSESREASGSFQAAEAPGFLDRLVTFEPGRKHQREVRTDHRRLRIVSPADRVDPSRVVGRESRVRHDCDEIRPSRAHRSGQANDRGSVFIARVVDPALRPTFPAQPEPPSPSAWEP